MPESVIFFLVGILECICHTPASEELSTQVRPREGHSDFSVLWWFEFQNSIPFGEKSIEKFKAIILKEGNNFPLYQIGIMRDSKDVIVTVTQMLCTDSLEMLETVLKSHFCHFCLLLKYTSGRGGNGLAWSSGVDPWQSSVAKLVWVRCPVVLAAGSPHSH